MVTTVLVVLMILALLEIVLLNGARLFFMIVSEFRPRRTINTRHTRTPKSNTG